MNLKKLFRPKSLAIIGGYWADFVYDGNKTIGYKGKVWHINPSRKSTKTKKYYKDIKDLPEIPDCVYLAVSRDQTVKLIKVISNMGVGGTVCLASRFSELNSKEGKNKTNELIKNSGKMPFLGPNCYGFINYLDKISVWSDQISGKPTKKGVAIICQSGTIGNTISFNNRSLPIGYIISLGNQSKITIEDAINYALDDSRVTAIGIYAESFTNTAKLINVFKKSKLKKTPIAIVKVGRSKIASKTILTHTGSLSGKEDIYDSLFQRMGIAKCNTLGELCEILKLFHTHGVLKSDQISIMGPSGGDMAMIGDVAESLSLKFGKIHPKIKNDLKKVNHPSVIISNPFDLQTYNWNDPENLEKTFKLIFKTNFALNALMLDLPNIEDCDTEEWDAIVDKFIKSSKVKKNGAIISSLSDTLPKYLREKCLKYGVVPLQGMSESLLAISNSIKVGKVWENFADIKIPEKIPNLKKKIKTYSEYESKLILKKNKIPIPKSLVTNKRNILRDSKKIGFPLVAKINSNTIFHKTEIGGVITNINNENELKKITNKFSGNILIEKMITDNVFEMIIGIKNDNEFGPTIILGAGGIYTELFKDTTTLLLPLTKRIILEEIKKLKFSKILFGFRGKSSGDLDALVSSILKIAKFAENNYDKISEVDINPLIVCKKGKGVFAVDALIHYFK
ncbi:acetate--CoA ligase family protein [Alphaproteobacteria bacterium]|nr:acetate--CoA ligase family protein [Alphaproteobacteria bacterium]